jgi:hypothetical protein
MVFHKSLPSDGRLIRHIMKKNSLNVQNNNKTIGNPKVYRKITWNKTEKSLKFKNAEKWQNYL